MVDLIARVYIDNIHKTQQLNPRKNMAKNKYFPGKEWSRKTHLLQNRIYGCCIKHLFVKYLLRVYLDITPLPETTFTMFFLTTRT